MAVADDGHRTDHPVQSSCLQRKSALAHSQSPLSKRRSSATRTLERKPALALSAESARFRECVFDGGVDSVEQVVDGGIDGVEHFLG